MKKAVLFDMGNTLVRYYRRQEFPDILRAAVRGAGEHLIEQGLLRGWSDEIWERVRQEDYEAADHRVRPLADRLEQIFGLSPAVRAAKLDDTLCRRFLTPIFAVGRVYDDTPAALELLRARGFRTAIVSNTPWGSPGSLWREELARLGLAERVDALAFCTDVGWRKPARPVFDRALQMVGSTLAEAVFVGDDPRWDVAGPQAMGMDAVLLDRSGSRVGVAVPVIRGLGEVWQRVAAM